MMKCTVSVFFSGFLALMIYFSPGAWVVAAVTLGALVAAAAFRAARGPEALFSAIDAQDDDVVMVWALGALVLSLRAAPREAVARLAADEARYATLTRAMGAGANGWIYGLARARRP
jgi:hypothetical protein